MFSHVGLWFTYMALPPTHHPIAIAMSATSERHDLIRYGVVKTLGPTTYQWSVTGWYGLTSWFRIGPRSPLLFVKKEQIPHSM